MALLRSCVLNRTWSSRKPFKPFAIRNSCFTFIGINATKNGIKIRHQLTLTIKLSYHITTKHYSVFNVQADKLRQWRERIQQKMMIIIYLFFFLSFQKPLSLFSVQRSALSIHSMDNFVCVRVQFYRWTKCIHCTLHITSRFRL